MQMKLDIKNGNVVIDGREFRGGRVIIRNGKVTVDGKVQNGYLVGDINIVVHGDVDRLENSCGTVKANNVGTISTISGDIECGAVSGSVSTMSGDVKCGNIRGSVTTMSGDINNQ